MTSSNFRTIFLTYDVEYILILHKQCYTKPHPVYQYNRARYKHNHNIKEVQKQILITLLHDHNTIHNIRVYQNIHISVYMYLYMPHPWVVTYFATHALSISVYQFRMIIFLPATLKNTTCEKIISVNSEQKCAYI